VVAETSFVPSGLGFLPTGEAIVVSMIERKLYSIALDGTVCEYADMTAAANTHCNDMGVGADGRAYVGAGYDMEGGPPPGPGTGQVILVDTDRTARVVAEGLDTPNGIVVSRDGQFLIVAESAGPRLTKFRIQPDGSLCDQSTYFQFTDRAPDGIAIDCDGAVWAGTLVTHEFVRVLEGGEFTDRIVFPETWAVACALGGPDGRTLFMCVGTNEKGEMMDGHDFMAKKVLSYVATATVDIPAF
jgi:sugar lactone lactonase YvrE